MLTSCHYHPSQPAHFICDRCETAFCMDCISIRDRKTYKTSRTEYFCPKCNLPASSLGVAHLLTPFWNRLPQFFLYPFQLQSLLLIVILTSLGAIFPASFLVSLFVGVIMTKYAFTVLNHTAHGKLAPPTLSLGMLQEDLSPVFKLIALLAVSIFGIMASFSLGPLPGFLILLTVAAGFPAMLMVLASSNSIGKAINPFTFIPVATRIGWAYFLMYLFLVFIASAPAALAHFVSGLLPTSLVVVLTLAGAQYYNIMAYHLMGYVLLQYHDQVGYEVDYEDIAEHLPQSKKTGGSAAAGNGVIWESEVLTKDGRFDEAIELLRNALEKEKGITLIAERYFKLLKTCGKTAELLAFAPHYLERLIANNEKRLVRQVYKECISADREFILAPEIQLKTAEILSKEGAPQEAVNAYVRFTKAYPKHELLAESYFQLARILNERLHQIEKAREILTTLSRKFTEHPTGKKAHAYLQSMQ